MAGRPRRTVSGNANEPWRARLRRYRFTHNIKQAALAADLGVTQAMVSRWESGMVAPSAEMQARIRALFDEDDMSAPLVDWRSHTAAQPGIAAVINPAGIMETASTGLLRLLGRDRGAVEGRRVDDLFSEGPPELYQTLLSAGFFDGALESVESAERYSFVDGEGQMTSCCIEGLHWPHLGETGERLWMLSGARIGEADYEALCREMAGKVVLVASR